MSEPAGDGLEVARIVIVRTMIEDDLIDSVTAYGAQGEQLGLGEALGMMRLAEDTLIRTYMAQTD